MRLTCNCPCFTFEIFIYEKTGWHNHSVPWWFSLLSCHYYIFHILYWVSDSYPALVAPWTHKHAKLTKGFIIHNLAYVFILDPIMKISLWQLGQFCSGNASKFAVQTRQLVNCQHHQLSAIQRPNCDKTGYCLLRPVDIGSIIYQI